MMQNAVVAVNVFDPSDHIIFQTLKDASVFFHQTVHTMALRVADGKSVQFLYKLYRMRRIADFEAQEREQAK